ncbi:hypothetical protein [Caloramator sp. Dgby_cultured_2]|nr:hypothetical protein [Caloramator sp. Dgby_cultured_2]WDU83271.1 hypothetical protein PWK10_00515 [Caloramator sp. Dgby_cultured_2]
MVKEKLVKINEEYIVVTFDEIFSRYKNLIHNLCKKWQSKLEYADLFQVASIGLYKAF